MYRIVTSLLFALMTSAIYGQALRVAPSGQVGIGVYEPQQQLDVRGDIFTTGFFVPTDGRLSVVDDEFTYGLDEVLQLSPMTYRYTGEAGLQSHETHVGVTAQELQRVAPELVSEFSHKDHKDAEYAEQYLQVDDAAIKYMLINAIKEQNKVIEDLQRQISRLQDQLSNGTNADAAAVADIMYQNAPNPYSDVTYIDYDVARDATDAQIHIHDFTGALVRAVDIDGGKGRVQLSAADLPTGLYSYSLVVAGDVVASKKMSVYR